MVDNMGIAFAFLLYVTLFRLTIIATGVISIVLGYRLFCRGIWPDSSVGQETYIEANVAGSRFTLKNAAPGTCFALFGVLVISVMLVQSPPGFSFETLNNASKLVLRGGEDNTLQTLTQAGIEYERQHNTDKAMAAYREAVTLAALPMNYLAWLYQKEGQFDKGLPLARVAVMVMPDNADIIDTLAVILCKAGEDAEALHSIGKAAELNPTRYALQLEKFKSGSCE